MGCETRRRLHAFAATATYDFNRFDTLLNLAVLVFVSTCLIVSAARGELGLGGLFWLPFGLFVGALQLLANIVMGTQGFSLVWCALFGILLYEEVRWQRFTDGDTLLRGLAALTGALVGLTLVLYAVDELCPLPHLVPRQRRPCGEMIYARAGTTLLHGLTLLVAAGLTYGADEWHDDRRGVFYAALGAAVLVLLCIPCALRCRPAAARVQPITMTPEQMAVALLQEQLLKTRERGSYLRAAQTRRLQEGQPADEAEAKEIRQLDARERLLLSKIEAKEESLSERTTNTGASSPADRD